MTTKEGGIPRRRKQKCTQTEHRQRIRGHGRTWTGPRQAFIIMEHGAHATGQAHTSTIEQEGIIAAHGRHITARGGLQTEHVHHICTMEQAHTMDLEEITKRGPIITKRGQIIMQRANLSRGKYSRIAYSHKNMNTSI